MEFVACEILDFVACEILNFEHCSNLTAHLDSVLRSAKMDISHENFNHSSYLTAHLDSVLRSAKFDISLEFTQTLLEACTTDQFELHTVRN